MLWPATGLIDWTAISTERAVPDRAPGYSDKCGDATGTRVPFKITRFLPGDGSKPAIVMAPTKHTSATAQAAR